jgi:hypothetical protein
MVWQQLLLAAHWAEHYCLLLLYRLVASVDRLRVAAADAVAMIRLQPANFSIEDVACPQR